jgi:hypothetical protein
MTGTLGGANAGMRIEDIPATVIIHAKLCILDCSARLSRGIGGLR